MRYHIIEKIKENTQLAEVFNAYLKGLQMYELSLMPAESVGQWLDSIPKDPLYASTRAARFYELLILSNTLGDLHKNLMWALEHLNKFFAPDSPHQQDLKAYAIQERLRVIDEYGSEDESDWEEDGFDEEGQKWKVAYKDDEEALRPYQLRSELAQYFRGADSMGEKIGTSDHVVFHYFSVLVEKQTELCPLKFFAQVMGKSMPLYRQTPDGGMEEMPLADQIENEINKDINNATLVAIFNERIEDAVELAVFFEEMDPTSVDDFRTLRDDIDQLLHHIWQEPAA